MRAVSIICGLLLPLAVQAETSVEAFSPEGTVKGVRQVKARFSAQMVPFGELRLSDPFDADCADADAGAGAAAGKGRWVDGRNWVYDFERDLPAGVACRFTLKPALSDVAGKPLAGERSYSFNTGGPSIAASMPRAGAGYVDENQVFILNLDAAAREDDIAKHAYCTAEGINEKIPVRLLAGKERDQLLDARKDFVNRHMHVYYATRGLVWHTAVQVRSKRGEQLPVSVVQCKRRLPQDAKVTLVWGAAITAPNGLANAHDQVLSFKTRPDFTAKFSCERPSAKGACIPFLPMRVNFTAPVRADDARAIALAGPGGKTWKAQLSGEEAKNAFVNGLSIPGPFPENAKLRLLLPEALKDDAGRSLLNQARFPMAVQTGELPPLVKFPARFGIIEARGDKLLPVTVRNVEAGIAARMAKAGGAGVDGNMLRIGDQAGDGQDQQVIDWLRRLGGKDRKSGWVPHELYGLKDSVFTEPKDSAQPKTTRFSLPKPGGRKAFEVIGIPLRKPGFYVVELASPKLGLELNGKRSLAYVSAAALVTNMVAHFKHGAESSLVWVTSLDKGQPVPNAQVAVRACTGKLLWQGKTDAMGVASIRQQLFHDGCPYNEGYYVSARSGDDMTFTLSNWDQGIESWRFNVPINDLRADNTVATTIFDRTLLRTGETVHMKHFIRSRNAGGFGYGAEPGKDKLIITHQGSEQKYELPLTWAGGGIAESSWTIPADAKQGWYEVMFNGRVGGTFRVEQFRVPTMKALLQGPSAPVVQAPQLTLDVQLSYLSGGGAAGAQVKLRTNMMTRGVHFEDYDDFAFAMGDVKSGKVQSGPAFDEDEGEFEGMEGEGETGAESGPVKTQSLTLDRAGGARVVLDKLPKIEQPQDLLAEMSYQDANGETLSSSTRVPLWPSNHVIGIKPDSWVLSKAALKFQVAVLDVQGKPVADAPVEVDFFQRLTYSHRRRLIGGFYAYENSSEIKALGHACAGKTDAKGLLLCDVAAPVSGNLILRAITRDGEQRPAVTNRETWVADGENWWFKASDDDRIDLLPERKRYEPGESATFQLRMPFREATALVTVEREGIIDTYVRQLSGSAPVFSIPVKGNYAPNMFVSALVVRGRVAEVQPTALVDLGKPAYKMGVAQVRVGWAAHELKVAVKTDRQVYKVRQQAQVAVKVTRADGSPAPAGAEVALAAVDVGLLELMPNASWDLLETMMQQRGLQVETSTAQMQVVGKRHFGRKAVPHGGGGGKGGGRELFDTLLFWKARVKLDANGEASVQVPVNDSLTAFRIVAIASANADLFGTGRAEIRSAQDVMLLSGLPAMVREGDKFRAGFTLRNATDGDLKVELGAQVSGKELPRQVVALAAGLAQEVGWDYQVPAGAAELAWDVTARIVNAADATPADRLRAKQTVKTAVPVRTIQATLLQLDKPQTMQVQAPADALPGRGGVQTLFASRLGSELPGVRDYMQAYPYTCFEQNTSRAIALRDRERWQKLAAQLPAYLDSDGLLKYFPVMELGSDSLTAYVLSAVQEAGYTIPAELKARMEDGLLNFVQGRITRGSPLATADLAVRKLAALEALSRVGRVTAAELESFSLEPNLWPTSAVIDWYLILQRSAKLPQREQRSAQAEQILKSRLNLQGTTMGFSTERNDDWWWLMVSGDSNANRLLLAMADNPAWQADIGRLARGALGRQRKGHWNTTVANAWGVLALDKFSRKFENDPVIGNSSAAIDSASKSVALDAKTASGSALLPWPRGAAELSQQHAGSGKPWVTVQSLAAVPLKAPVSSGYKIVKTITPVEQAVKGAWTRGDVYRVRLDLEAQADMTWVVVDDPIPASASVLGTGLGKDSQLLTAGEKSKGWVWPAFQERSFEAFRSYYEFVPKGKWSVEYTVRLNNAGLFQLPPTRVEAMYSPEAYAESPNPAVSVK